MVTDDSLVASGGLEKVGTRIDDDKRLRGVPRVPWRLTVGSRTMEDERLIQN